MRRFLAVLVVVAALLLGAAPPPATATPSRDGTVRVAALVCGRCGKPIVGKYYERDGVAYHPQCYVDQFHLICPVCHKPVLGRYYERDGHVYHAACYVKAFDLHCAVDGEPLLGTYLTDFWGNKYHPEHASELPRCEYCGRFISPRSSEGGVRYSDGRAVCGICLREIVHPGAQTAALVRKIRKRLAALGIAIPYGEVPLQEGDRSWLARQRGSEDLLDAPADSPAFTRELTTTRGARTTKTVSIFCLDQMPLTAFSAAIAHEYMHVYLFLSTSTRRSPELEEGSAEFAAALYLQTLHTKEARYQLTAMAKDPDPTYGDGYRRVCALVSQIGVAGWLAGLKTWQDFPIGY